MKIRIHQLYLKLEYKDSDILKFAAKKLNCQPESLSIIRVNKRSIDARPRHPEPLYTLSVDVEFTGSNLSGKFKPNEVQILTEPENIASFFSPLKSDNPFPPVVIGAGPAGLYAALVLAESGLKPILIERGAAVTERSDHVEQFWTKDILNVESNVLYGEGGAGLFSDGKLTARSKDKPRIRYLLQTLVDNGAPEDILLDWEPHVGTDLLANIVPNMRNKIISLGGTVKFNSQLTNLIIKDKNLVAVQLEDETIETNHCILATGHSARDVYDMLHQADVPLQSKPIAIGVRVEVPQIQVNRAQWGKFAEHPKLGAASYRLTRKSQQNARACYSFCMCPGGTVISCASTQGEFTTNGMSHSTRGGNFANAAYLVPVNPDDYFNDIDSSGQDVLAGYRYQQEIEKKAYLAGGGNYHIPASTLPDFLNKSNPTSIPNERSWHFAFPANLYDILPEFITNTLEIQIPQMLKELNRVGPGDVLIYAPETRSSSPIRIERNEYGESTGLTGLFPAGEGAGYAGGIVSSAIDGIKAAEAVIKSILT